MTALTIIPADVIREAHAAYHLAMALPASAGIDPEARAVEDALAACGEFAKITAGGELDPVKFEGDGFIGIVMPVRI